MIGALTALVVLLLGIGATFGLILLGALLRGWVVFKLWGWFMVSALHVPAIGVATAMGLSLMVAFTTMNPNDYAEETDKKKKLGKAVASLLMPFLVLLIGYVAYLYQ